MALLYIRLPDATHVAAQYSDAQKAICDSGVSTRLVVGDFGRVRTQVSRVGLVRRVGERSWQLLGNGAVLDPGSQRVEQCGRHTTRSPEAVADARCRKVAIKVFYFGNDLCYAVVVVFGTFGRDDAVGLENKFIKVQHMAAK